MKLKKILLPLMAVFVIGCASDDAGIPVIEEIDPVDFIVIGENANSVVQLTYDASSDSEQSFNLSEEINVGLDYLTLRQSGDLISFYSFADGAFSLAQKNLRTNQTNTYDDFFANSPGRSVAWGINNDTNVFFGFFGPNNARNLGIQDVQLEGTDSNDVTIDFDIDFVFQPLLYDDKVYFAYRDNQNNYKFTFYNTLTRMSGPILNFGPIPISFLVSDVGDIVIIENGTSPNLGNYDPETLTLLDETPLNFGTALSQGPIPGAVLDGNRLYYARPTIQPARLFAEPAIFDLTTQEDFQIDLTGIITELEQEIETDITITTLVFSASKNVFLVGYRLLETGVSGGVLQISPDGKLIKNVAVRFFPTFFVQD